MQTFLTWFSSLDPQTQSAVAGLIAGALLWALQGVWTRCPWLPGSPETDTWKQRLAAVVLAVIAGLVQSHGDVTSAWGPAIAAFASSQAVHLLTKSKTTKGVELSA